MILCFTTAFVIRHNQWWRVLRPYWNDSFVYKKDLGKYNDGMMILKHKMMVANTHSIDLACTNNSSSSHILTFIIVLIIIMFILIAIIITIIIFIIITIIIFIIIIIIIIGNYGESSVILVDRSTHMNFIKMLTEMLPYFQWGYGEKYYLYALHSVIITLSHGRLFDTI